VKQYLDGRLHAQPEAYRALHGHWAQQEQARDRPYSAIHHALLAGTPAHAVQLAESLAARWRRAKNWSVVTGTLGTLPQEHLTPGLLALLALAHLETGETETAVGLLSGVQSGAQTALCLIVQARLVQQQGRLDDALNDVQMGLQIATQEVDTIGLLQLRARIVATQSQSDEAIKDAQDALQRATRMGAADVRIEALGTLGTVYSRLGQIGEAVNTIALSVEMALQSGYVNRVVNSVLYLKNQYLCMGRVQEADVLLRRYLEAARVTSPKGVLAGEMALGHLLFVKGEVVEAEALLRASFDTFIIRGNYAEAYAAFNPLLDLLLETGQREIGRRLWRQLYGFLVVDHDPWDRVNKMNSDALLLHAEGHHAQAEEQALGAVRLAATISPVMLFQTELLILDLKRLSGTLQQHDLAALSAAYEGDPDYHIDILQTWRIYSAMLSYSQAKRWSVPLFALVAERREHEWHSGEKPGTTGPSLKLGTLGAGRVLIDETPIQITSQTYEEILAYLAVHALTPDLLQQDEIAQAIWGNGKDDLKRARSSLRTARHNINRVTRGVLGTELITSGGRGHKNTTWRLSPGVDVQCDALDLLQVTDPAEAARLAPQAGMFLTHRRSEWVQDMRRRLAEHLAQVLTQGAAETERRDARTALSWLVNAANLAPTPEAFSAIERFGDRQRGGPLAEMAALTVRQAAEGQPLSFTNRALN
jgi:LuxR family maltose regulon positive regulatory protein